MSAIQSRIFFVRQSEASQDELLICYYESATKIVARIKESGVERDIVLDLTNAVPGHQYDSTPPRTDFFYQVEVLTDDGGLTVWKRSARGTAYVPSGTDLPATIRFTPDSTTVYPYTVYKKAGQADPPLSNLPASVSWVTYETPTQKATRIKNIRVADWRGRTHKLATDFIHGCSHIREWVHRHANRGHDNPNFYRALNPASTFEMNEMEAGINACFHRAKLIGLLERTLSVYNDPAYGAAMVWPQCTVWAQNDTIKTGDYRRHSNNRIWVAKQDHTSANANAPSTSGGATYWEQAKMNSVPASIVKSDNTSVAINIATGAGIEELFTEVEAECKAFGAYDYYKAARGERAHWTTNHDNNEIHFIDATTHRSKLKIFDATVAPHNSADSNQRSAADVHSSQNWASLGEKDFLQAFDYEAPASS